ncbi:alpha-glucan family phosphorylase [Candidatus Peregrinibacteria bacterium]|nr:alpha-glucan family phosphorylase [Candidatus Peregrinibacteria bacterium]MBI3816104.1 alpha-glucan family phosphorylase [Candidatus Peregrinibacteria bacterium]
MSKSLTPRHPRGLARRLTVAYFTMEIAATDRIPTFAGGLGVLAADIMRSSADLGVDAACVSVCWQFGYLKQAIRPDGTQSYEQVAWDPSKELTKLPQTISVQIERRTVKVGAWMMEYTSGNSATKGHAVPLYFLDTNLPENTPEDRAITQHLYGGDAAMRMKQEVVLGCGGVRMLRALGYDDVGTFHMNEGHCAFLTLELLRERGFNDALVRGSCAFTTHTPIKAGHDVFGYELAWRIAGNLLPWHIKKLAGEDALSMTQLAMTLSRYTCGVSAVHGEVARKMLGNSAIDSITNGVHHVEWVSPDMTKLFNTYIAGWQDDPSLITKHCRDIPDDALWHAHEQGKLRLLHVVREQTGLTLNPDRLTIASARRVVAYKRPELLYTDLVRLKEVCCGRVQIIHAGNAHPGDVFAQEVIHRMIDHSKELRDCMDIAYLPNYNPELAKLLVAGADVWLNTPARLHEASGTSGMKACLNGTINLSTLDGWWVEGYHRDPESGWRIGPLALPLGDEDTRRIDAEDLYTQLQYAVIPEYEYPGHIRWLRRMKRSIGLMGHFNANRCVQEYVSKAWNR